MRLFICLLDPQGRGIPEAVWRAYESLPRRRGLEFQWQSVGQGRVLTAWDDPYGDPLVASDGDYVAVGTARLDNRADLVRWSACNGHRLSDLDLVLRTVAQHGTTYVPQFLGDFAFVIWNPGTRIAVVACDAFVVKRMYYAERNGLLAFASRGDTLALEDRYDAQYLAERLAACTPSPWLSVYAGVKCLPAGTIAVLERGKLTTHQYWSAYSFEPDARWQKSKGEAVEICRNLLIESVRLRLGNNGDTWAQLSGGMDSSSVVSVAQWLACHQAVGHGLAGTVTYSDSHGTGADEREYSDAVASQWRIRNETIVDPPLWHDDQYAPTHTDEPSDEIMFYPRDYRLCAIVRGEGGRVLLTGVGGDVLFAGNMFFFADWVARGHIWPALREMARRAAIGRASFWELAYRNAVLPLLPRLVQHRLVNDIGHVPPWVPPGVARQYGLHERAFALLSYAGRIGSKYHDAVAAAVTALSTNVPVRVIEDTLDVRHPYLYRPLVEFALRLPPELCVQPYARKWVLREAMRGFLPEAVRTRIGKGTFYGLLAWSIATQRTLLEPLVQHPILADLGVIDAAQLRASFESAQHTHADREKLSAVVQHTLTVEAWLQMRSGRWPCEGHLSSATSGNAVHSPSI